MSAPAASTLRQTRDTLEMIKVSHSVFALPFALCALVLASGGWPAAPVLMWALVAMVSARSAAMAFNRLVDRRFDADNPRTRDRALPAGRLSARFVTGFTVVACVVFVAASAMLNPLCLALSPVALAVILGYSLAKRFTAWCHAWLGLALGLTPLAGWLAVRGVVDAGLLVPAAWALAVLCWVTGFDLIYACQDEEFDRQQGLRSVPARVGTARTLGLSLALHGAALAALVLAGLLADFGAPYLASVGLVAILLGVEQVLARKGRPEHLHQAFTLNSLVGLCVLGGVGLEVLA